ncbi:MAG: aminomethyl-transferring glycine dehydrogenase [Candidatus Marinimicrobia bacterium]|jgi:glycine dehydrogenase|nr:aminomethyl-transferring glycine dehydrogenase [Candidatus Neomarinimicrobiota bacterium]
MLKHLPPADNFSVRHIGPDENEISTMLETLGLSSLDELVQKTVPAEILDDFPLNIGEAVDELNTIKTLRTIAEKNTVILSYIGQGYTGTITPPVILRNVLENPGWYTQYTPYQAEISQGRLEALLNFQTMVCDMTGMDIANASLLDEATAAAEAMAMIARLNPKRNIFYVAKDCHPQTIAVLQTRAEPIGIHLIICKENEFQFNDDTLGILVQYPAADGRLIDYTDVCKKAEEAGALAAVAADLLSLAMLKPPGEWGADVVVGSSQRFGVPMGYGGPHAAFFATHKKYERKVPGRIIGVSRDIHGNTALRMALQTREQHIRRDRATSNICTAQVLLAIMSGMYAVYHGPHGIRRIAERVNTLTALLAGSLEKAGFELINDHFFDTIRFKADPGFVAKALEAGMLLRDFGDGTLGITIDETSSIEDINDILNVFGAEPVEKVGGTIQKELFRTSSFLDHPVFNTHHSETEMLRYIYKLQQKDLSLATSMIPLGSCTMKLNATTEMLGITWPEFAYLHPFAPSAHVQGYQEIITELGDWLCNMTGFTGYSFQSNSGAQGEFAGLKVISAFHRANGDEQRNVCLIPASAHGTNPASAVMNGMKVVVVKCDEDGNIDMADLTAKAEAHSAGLAAFMVTYPSTHGVFEAHIKDVCRVIHDHGGQVYLDGANLNALVGLCKPADFGADVCHINLHKTFCIPHGGGGPGMGPIFMKDHLTPFLPDHPTVSTNGNEGIKAVSAAPFGSASILPISWAYIKMLGSAGMKKATQIAILNANYMAMKLSAHFDILYTGQNGMVGHEFIVDMRPFRKTSGITDEDVAKRLMDYGFHAPTMSFPVPGTLMIEPTESEAKAELDRFCKALIQIKEEILAIENGEADKNNNVLKNAPHTAQHVTADEWPHSYSREQAAYPAEWTKDGKFWPAVGRVDNAYGDRNLVCSCPPIEDYED